MAGVKQDTTIRRAGKWHSTAFRGSAFLTSRAPEGIDQFRGELPTKLQVPPGTFAEQPVESSDNRQGFESDRSSAKVDTAALVTEISDLRRQMDRSCCAVE